MENKKVYRMSWRDGGSGGSGKRYGMLNVPSDIARMLFERNIQEFTAEITDEGILYRPVLDQPDEPAVPDWLKKRE